VDIPSGSLEEPVDLELALAQLLGELDAGDHNTVLGGLEGLHQSLAFRLRQFNPHHLATR
jgi:hypothetical protein